MSSEFVRLEVADGVGTIRLDRPKMNAISFQVQDELLAVAAEATERSDVRAVVVWGGERVFAAGNDVKEMADKSYVDLIDRGDRVQGAVHGDRPDPEAGRGRCQRLCTRRRLRAGHGGGRPVRRGGRGLRAAGGAARNHPGRRWDPAAEPVGRAGEGQGAHVHRSVREGRRGAVDRARRPGVPGRAGLRRRCRLGVEVQRRRPPTHCARSRRASTAGLETDLETGLAIERQLFASVFATDDRTIGMQSFIENGPGKARFEGR